ncbi:MAG TPA: hypothetical protein VNF28_06345 [Candidatus Binataceae bacterium]|nr:hypothetical protein [Candidatus Binataceae bacterium]
MGTIRVARYIGSIASLAVLLSACATAQPPQAALAPAARSASGPPVHIYVTEDSLDAACYRKVGEVSHVEPFSAAVTDPENLGIADELRKAAIKKYPNQVDAIINVHTEDHDIGSEVLVSGEAIQLEPPSKLDCKLPDKIAAAFVNFATGYRTIGERRGAASDTGFNGPAGTTNGVQDRSGADQGWQIGENARHGMIATMPGQTEVSDGPLVDQVQLQQLEIKRLRKRIDKIVKGQCEAADVSSAQCASMRKSAELVGPHEVVAVANKGADDNSPSVFEIQNLIQAQTELITKLRHQLADMNEPADQAAGANALKQ